jgi:hypothetical protein
MSAPPKKSKDATAFLAEFKQLVEKYDLSIEVDTGYYGDVDGIEVCCGQKRVATFDRLMDGWTFEELT